MVSDCLTVSEIISEHGLHSSNLHSRSTGVPGEQAQLCGLRQLLCAVQAGWCRLAGQTQGFLAAGQTNTRISVQALPSCPGASLTIIPKKSCLLLQLFSSREVWYHLKLKSQLKLFNIFLTWLRCSLFILLYFLGSKVI